MQKKQQEMTDAFVELTRFVADGILVQKIKSKNTGLTIIKADVEGDLEIT